LSGLITFENSGQAGDAIKADGVCKTIGKALVKHYPNRQWYVDVSISGGVAKILCPSISVLHGYTLHIKSETDDNLQKKAIRAGGQILEMFKLSRARNATGGEEFILRDARGEALQAKTGL